MQKIKNLKIKNLVMKFSSLFAVFALMIGIITSNSACSILWHQPKEPKAMDKFKF